MAPCTSEASSSTCQIQFGSFDPSIFTKGSSIFQYSESPMATSTSEASSSTCQIQFGSFDPSIFAKGSSIFQYSESPIATSTSEASSSTCQIQFGSFDPSIFAKGSSMFQYSESPMATSTSEASNSTCQIQFGSFDPSIFAKGSSMFQYSESPMATSTSEASSSTCQIQFGSFDPSIFAKGSSIFQYSESPMATSTSEASSTTCQIQFGSFDSSFFANGSSMFQYNESPMATSTSKASSSTCQIQFGSIDPSFFAKGFSMFLEAGNKHNNKTINFEVQPITTEDHNDRAKYFMITDSNQSKYKVCKTNKVEKAALVLFKYQFTLKEWLATSPTIWSPIHEMWNRDPSEYNLHNTVPERKDINWEWNFLQLEEEVGAVIQAIVRAVWDSHANNIVNGHLDNPENFLLNIRKGVVTLVECMLLQESTLPIFDGACPPNHPRVKSKRLDFDHLKFVILSSILGKTYSELPKEMQHFISLLEYYETASWRDEYMFLLLDHSSLWSSTKKIGFWLGFYFGFDHQRKNKHKHSKITYACIMKNVFDRMTWLSDWMSKIPPKTPIERLWMNNKYTGDCSELYRFVRIEIVHFDSMNVEDNGKSNYKYVTEEDSHYYLDPEFIVAVIEGCFPEVMIFTHLELMIQHRASI